MSALQSRHRREIIASGACDRRAPGRRRVLLRGPIAAFLDVPLTLRTLS